MAWRYRKRIKIIPGVYLNLSKSGISTSVGMRGANLTLGKSGTYLNSGLPGTGIYQRQRLSGSNQRIPEQQIDLTDARSYPEIKFLAQMLKKSQAKICKE